MKKRISIVVTGLCLCLLFTVGICLPSSNIIDKTEHIKGPVLIDRLQSNTFNLPLIYSNITTQHIEVFDVAPATLSLNTLSYTSFTEGFISVEKNNQLLSLINLYRSTQDLEPISYYYNYIETDHYDFVSLSSGLDSLYIINQLTGEVTTPHFTTSNAEEKQYIYHIVETEDAFYILAAKANSYEALWYCIDTSTFNVIAHKSFVPPLSAVKRNQYALDSEGTAYFVGDHSLYIISLTDSYSIPLSFTPDELYWEHGQLYAFGVSELFLNYVILDCHLQTNASGRVNLPNREVSLVDSFLDNNMLYTITYDVNHPLYRNYLTLYNLDTSQIIYCRALKANHELALLGFLNDIRKE